jgi:hypothetical protein
MKGQNLEIQHDLHATHATQKTNLTPDYRSGPPHQVERPTRDAADAHPAIAACQSQTITAPQAGPWAVACPP